MKIVSAIAFVIACLAATLVDGSERPPNRAKGWVWEVHPVQGRLVVRVEERGAFFARTFRVRTDTAIVSYAASPSVASEPSLPDAVELSDLTAGDEVVVIYRFENGRDVASFVETRK